MNYQPSTPELLRVAGLPEDTVIDVQSVNYRSTMHELSKARRAFEVACASQPLGEVCIGCMDKAERMCDLADKVYSEHGIRVITASERAVELAAKTVDYTPPRTELPVTERSFQ